MNFIFMMFVYIFVFIQIYIFYIISRSIITFFTKTVMCWCPVKQIKLPAFGKTWKSFFYIMILVYCMLFVTFVFILT